MLSESSLPSLRLQFCPPVPSSESDSPDETEESEVGDVSSDGMHSSTDDDGDQHQEEQ